MKPYLAKFAEISEYLRKARREVASSGNPLVVSTVRNVTERLISFAQTHNAPEVMMYASRVAAASEASFLPELEKLIQSLNAVIAGQSSDGQSILVIDDDEMTQRLIEAFLQSTHRRLHFVDSLRDADEALANQPFSLILLDLILPDGDGRNYLARLKQESATSSIPVIVLTSKENEAIRMECLGLGATEYFVKPLQLQPLAIAIERNIARLRPAEPMVVASSPVSTEEIPTSIAVASPPREDRRLQREYRLSSRAEFQECYLREVAAARKTGMPISMAAMDIDDFTQITIDHGTTGGEDAIRTVASQLAKALQPGEEAVRWGLDDFLVLLPGLSIEAAKLRIENWRKSFQDLLATSINPIHISVGVADVASTVELAEAMGLAKRYLYAAKQLGKNSIIAGSDELDSPNRTIIMAEDDEVSAALVAHRLNREGIEVFQFSNGSEAWNAAQTTTPSLFLLDVKMPVMDGFELLQKIRSEHRFDSVPVVMLTAIGKETDIVHGLELGADDYIIKPFSPTDLVARLSRLLAKKRGE
ncbi:MAG: response regulator [bacterium]|nr:response regulator [bacterium]